MNRFIRATMLLLAFPAIATFGKAGSAIATPDAFPVELTDIAVGFNTPIGIDFSPWFNEVIMSVNWSSGLPHNFDRISMIGVVTQFTEIRGLTEEVKIAIARDSLGGFIPGELFVGNGRPGQIARIAPDGSDFTNPWVILPGETGLLRGGLHVDTTGNFGGDLIVVTNTGGIWRVNSSGVPTRLAALNRFLEGVTVAPNNPELGPAAGKIIFNDGDFGIVKAIDADGNIIDLISGFPIDQLEDVDIILPDHNFFAMSFGDGKLVGAPAAEFAPFYGQILVTQEFGPGRISAISWNGSDFVLRQLAADRTQFEHVTFAPIGLPIATVDDPDYSITYDGWRGAADQQASGGGFRAASEAGQKITHKTIESASTVTLITYHGPDQGLAKVIIDGVDKGTLDLYAPAPEYQVLVEFSGLPLDRHKIVVKATGQKNPASSGTEIRVDGFQVGGFTVQDNSPEVDYNTWIDRPPVIDEAYGGSVHHSPTRDASVYFSFDGTQFTWITARGPSFGLADVYVDGVLVDTVDLYKATLEAQVLQVIDGLGGGLHSVQIKAQGAHSGSSMGNRVIFDGYSVP